MASDACGPSPLDEKTWRHLRERLARSRFRSRFGLGPKEAAYLARLDPSMLAAHARDFVRQRLAPAKPPHDGRQTPMRGHPVFVAQHATGTCCQGCLWKWHRIPAGRPLAEKEVDYVVAVLLRWIDEQPRPDPPSDPSAGQGRLF